MAEPALIVCPRLDGPTPAAPGSIPLECQKCGALVAVGPRSAGRILGNQRGAHMVWCEVCAAPFLDGKVPTFQL